MHRSPLGPAVGQGLTGRDSNACLSAVIADDAVKRLFGLRPDRVSVVAGADGWASADACTAGGATRTLQSTRTRCDVLHIGLFHPLDDHYGLAPLEAA